MLLKSADSSFQLSILGYEYPDAAGEPYDANWLSIQVKAAGPHGAWTGSDPCLLTYEAVRLADWLGAAADGKGTAPAVSFLEPVLLFRLINGERGRTLRVHFGNLINPSWKVMDSAAPRDKKAVREENAQNNGASSSRTVPDHQDLFLDFPLSETDLRTASVQLREALRRYPDRAEM